MQMSRFFQAALILALCGVVRPLLSQSSPPAIRGTEVSVHFVQPQHAFDTKESIRLRVELTNVSHQTLLVCRDLDFTSDSCSWGFDVHDASGRSVPGEGIVGDRGEGTPDPFPNVLISNWIALAPHYVYGTAIDVSLALGPNPRPGRYKVKATLFSGGPDEASSKNDLPRYPKELAALPFRGWKGKAESNSVWIQIAAKK
jgi:hypothetical protein